MTTEEFDATVMKLWLDIAVAVAAADNSTHKEAPAKWADKVVEDFKSRFKNSTYLNGRSMKDGQLYSTNSQSPVAAAAPYGCARGIDLPDQ